MEELSEAASLGAFGSEVGACGEPFAGFGELFGAGGVHSGEGGGELWAEGEVGFALCDDFVEGFLAAFAGEGLEEFGEDPFSGLDRIEV